MSEKKNDGGPAFPEIGMMQRGDQSFVGIYEKGMTLRDYFAAQCIASLIAHDLKHKREIVTKELATASYFIADTMLVERDKTKNPAGESGV